MKFTLSWLQDHLDIDSGTGAGAGIDLDRVASTLTAIGLEVESVEDRARDLAPFVVGLVTAADRHPNADRLQVCMVDTGSGAPVQVVCGAPNARAGMKGVFAPAGTRIPGTGVDLKKGVIRGVESNGMLCSEREMGLSDDHEGIIELPEDAPVGAPWAEIAGLADPVIEVAITPNRQDALGVHGIARDLAAAGLGQLKPLDRSPVPGAFDSPVAWHRDLPKGREDACPLVVGRYFRNLRNGPSPKWMQDRLRAIGLRPISTLVDITNYVSYDLARPLHVFDADRIAGDLTMRMARPGESLLALDGRSYALDEEMTVIADAERVHGIGGIMGGEDSGCTAETVNVFLEVALFDTVRTAATGRRLGIHSDARYRFERGVDPESARWGVEVATRLILDLCGGEASHVVSAGAMPDWSRKVSLRPARLETLGGATVSDARVEEILTAQGFTVDRSDPRGEGRWTVAVPTWRVFDVHGEADLIEDVLRIEGYDSIPAVSMPRDGAVAKPAIDAEQRRVRLARRALAGRGLLEAVTWSFMDSRHADLFGGGSLRLANPISSDLDAMRPSVLPNLVMAAQRNADRGFPDLGLFEIGPHFSGISPGDQVLTATGLRAGRAVPRHWSGPARPVDVFDAKADAMAALEAAGAPVASVQVSAEGPDWYHPGRVGAVKLGNKVLAWFGELHPRVLRALDAKGPMVGFEVDFDALPPLKARDAKTRPLLTPSPFQPVERDFAFVVDRSVPAGDIVRAAQGADKALIDRVEVFDVFEGATIGEGRKSVAIAVTLQPTEKTLTDEEIEAVAAKIVAQVGKKTGGTLRG